ncbi:MAG: hypothetical protein N2C12_02040 [Planctomycetales bacterium]
MAVITQCLPWIIFFTALTYLACAVYLFMAVRMVSKLSSFPKAATIAIGTFVALTGIYGVIGTLLLRYAISIGHFVLGHDIQTLEKTIEAQKKFWMITGIIASVILGLGVTIGIRREL